MSAGGKRGHPSFVRSTLRAVPANEECPLFSQDSREPGARRLDAVFRQWSPSPAGESPSQPLDEWTTGDPTRGQTEAADEIFSQLDPDWHATTLGDMLQNQQPDKTTIA